MATTSEPYPARCETCEGPDACPDTLPAAKTGAEKSWDDVAETGMHGDETYFTCRKQQQACRQCLDRLRRAKVILYRIQKRGAWFWRRLC